MRSEDVPSLQAGDRLLYFPIKPPILGLEGIHHVHHADRHH